MNWQGCWGLGDSAPHPTTYISLSLTFCTSLPCCLQPLPPLVLLSLFLPHVSMSFIDLLEPHSSLGDFLQMLKRLQDPLAKASPP